MSTFNFPLPSDAALAVLTKLSAGPSKSERLTQMQIDAQSTRDAARYRHAEDLARLDQMTSQMAQTSRRATASRDRDTERAEDREHAFEMLRRRQEFARETELTKQASKIQEAGTRLRGSGMRPGQERSQPSQRAIVTGPEGMLTSQGGGPTQRVEGVEEQLAAAQGLGQDIQFRRQGDSFQSRLVQGDQPTFARVTGKPAAQADPLTSIISDSSMSEADKIEMARTMDTVGRRGGLTMNQFLEQIEDREPVRLTADEYRAKRDRAVIALSRLDDKNSPEGKMLSESIEYYETKMMGRSATRLNPSAYRTVDSGPTNEPSRDALMRLLEQTNGDVDAAMKLFEGR